MGVHYVGGSHAGWGPHSKQDITNIIQTY